MRWFRIDNRLVHGQVIAAWLPYLRAKSLIVINDELAADPLRQEIMSLAVPEDVHFKCCPLVEAVQLFHPSNADTADESSLILFSTCPEARTAHEAGIHFPLINIGNLHYGPGKEQLCEYIAISQEDRACLHYFQDNGVTLDFRCVPSAPANVNF